MNTKIVTALSMLLLGCEAAPVSSAATNNPEVAVGLLFEHEGCRVYRFRDSGQLHYYAVCEGARPTFAMSKVYCGKGCVRDDSIPTEPMP
jgi:hypothetical protein